MTIDLSLVLNSRDAIIQWQRSRSRSNTRDVEILLDHIISITHHQRILRAKLNQTQARLNEYKKQIELAHHRQQQYLDPKNNDTELGWKSQADVSSSSSSLSFSGETHNITLEIELLKNEIPLLSKQLNDLTMNLQQNLLPKIGNVIDEKVFWYQIPFPDNNKNNTYKCDFTDFILDPLFCLNGYYQSTDGFHIGEEIIYLSGVGSLLNKALISNVQSYFSTMNLLDVASSHLNKHSSTDYNTWIPIRAPWDIDVDIHTAHTIMGCLTLDDGINVVNATKESITSVRCPSYIAISLLLHREKTYHDNQLPKCYIGIVINNQPEKINKDTKNTNKPTRKSILSYRLGHPYESIEFYVLSSSSLALSSKIQDNLAKGIVAFYESLISRSQDGRFFLLQKQNQPKKTLFHDDALEEQGQQSWIRARTVSANDLSMNESRRIRIEGYLQCKQMYVELGHVSNFTDYISRELQIHCGGKKDFVHIVHGIIDPIVALEFLLESNITCLGNNEQQRYGILLPQILSNSFQLIQQVHPNSSFEDDTLFLPFCRRFVKGKGGKIRTVDIEHGENGKAPLNGIRQAVGVEYDPPRISRNVNSSVDPSLVHNKFSAFNFDDFKQKTPTLRDIQYERMTSLPFLPFYST